MLNITGTPQKIQVTGEKLDDVIDNRQQAQAVAAAMPAPAPKDPKADDQA
jgi:ribosomal protein L12E/L44/L45/RPP1/RPP2